MKHFVLSKKYTFLLGAMFVATVSFGQATTQALTPPAGDSASYAAMRISFQKSMRWMDSILAKPTSPEGPYSLDEDEASKEISKMFHDRSGFYPYGNFRVAAKADSQWAARLGFTVHGPRVGGHPCTNGNWHSVGPVGDPQPHAPGSNDNRNGRLDCITFKPGDPNTLYVASGFGGGLWKVNGTTGSAVSLHTDNLSLHNGVGAVAASPGSPVRLIISTGQSYGPVDYGTWPSACTGVYYSDDEGLSWARATVTDKNGADPFAIYGDSHFKYVAKIIVNPSDPNKLLMAMYTRNADDDPDPLNYGGLFSSTDRGVTWTEIDDPNLTNRFFRDIAYNPVNPNIVYLTAQQHLYKSTNGGQTWADITSRLLNVNTLMPINDTDQHIRQFYSMNIMVPDQGCSQADGNHVSLIVSHYTLEHFYDYIIYNSADAFSTNVTATVPPQGQIDKTEWRLPYHAGYAMSYKPNMMYIAGHRIQRSDNGGVSFKTNNAYAAKTHADHQQIALPPFDGTNANVVFAATDGGLWRSDDSANTFRPLNDDLVINQFYGISASQSDNTLLGGAQDNSTIRRLQDGTWQGVSGGDGNRFSPISPTDPDVFAYADLQNKNRVTYEYRNTNNSITESNLYTTAAFGDRPMVYNGNTLMVAINKIYFESNGDTTQSALFSSALLPTERPYFDPKNFAMSLDFCLSQPNYIYVSTLGQWADSHGHFACPDTSINKNVDYNDPDGYNKYSLFKTADGGHTWTDVSPEFTGTIGSISSIAVDPMNPQRAWITYSGYDNNDGSNQNVYKTTDGGTTWLSYSTGLPLGNTEKILYVKGSPDDRLYLAMESGIFYRTKNMDHWECYEKGLPYTLIKDIDISYCSGKIYAATYGRGIWESDMTDNPGDYLPGETTIINSNTTWNSTKTMIGGLRIKSGATLTISGGTTKVFMPRSAVITVEPGAKLVVDGATITNECHDCEWGGIALTGNENQPPLPQYQGSLVLKNSAILENAYIAINNYSWDNGAQGGGLINATNSTIRNCWRAVALNEYGNYSYIYNGSPSQCHFDHMSFIVDDPQMYDSHGAPDYFTSYDTYGGVEITNSSFTNTIPTGTIPDNKRGRGIYTLATGLKVQNCTFSGLNEGVHCEGYANLPTRTVNVFLSTFSNINHAITLNGTAYANIKGNTINNMVLSSYDPSGAYGIYLNQSAGAYIGCHNDIDGNLGGTHNSRYGIIVNDSRKRATSIIDNTITNTYVATQTQRMNVSLHIFCNDYENNDYAWAINPQSANDWFTDQGTGCLPTDIRAGNIFKSNQKDILSYASPWSYSAGNGSPYEVPAWWAGAMTLNQCNTSANSQCNDFASCVYDWTDVIQGQVLSQYTELKNDGFKLRADAVRLYGHIIRGYNALNEGPQLQSFLEAENDDRSRKLLIPLYISKGLYSQATNTIRLLSLPDAEISGYNNYYNLLINLRQNNRRPDSLTPSELTMVESLAADTLEVSPYAKGYLDWWYQQAWENPIEPLPQSRGTGEVIEPETPGYTATSLGNAVPNPTNGITAIEVYIGSRDAMKHPVFIIRNTMGTEMYRQPLAAGANHIEVNTNTWGPGVYVYNLLLNNAVKASKKLSVTK